MTVHFPARTRLEAWVAACRHLRACKVDINVILSIEGPLSDGPRSLEAMQHIDDYLAREPDGLPVHTIAETIFPGWQYATNGIEGVYTTYPEEEYPRIKGPSDWGRYAYRLLRRVDHEGNVILDASGEPVNPLKVMIEKMKRQVGNRGTMRSCYELGVADGAFDLPLYEGDRDAKKIRNVPCLSHLSFKIFNGAVHLTAVYRSHCYRLKVFGNMLGLARLQACVANEVGLPVGTMVVHSTYAMVKERFQALEAVLALVEPLIDDRRVA